MGRPRKRVQLLQRPASREWKKGNLEDSEIAVLYSPPNLITEILSNTENEKLATVLENELEMSSGNSLEPDDSLEFGSKEDAFEFYKNYAVSFGFSVVIKASRRSRISGKFIDAKFVCSKYGSKRDPNPCGSYSELADATTMKKKRGRINRSWSKTDCKACMHVKRRQDGRWIISSFIREHNHDIVPNIRTKKKCMLVSHKTENQKSTSLCFGEGDAKVMLEYFSCMQDENPYFFYAVDLNKEQRLKNVFWVDAKGRIDYCNFGDVVFFDTMYQNNEFKLPFAPFIGMSNHFQCLLFGSALLADESKSTYVWLMRAWLKSMQGQAPKVILTEQDQMLKEAIAEVFPRSRHCFCLWHILGKIHEKLGHVIRKHEKFINKFFKCVLKSQTEAQFEKRWWKSVDRFDLRNDTWIQSLYDDRLRWVPTFMEDIFLAGLSSAQRLESISSLLDKYLLRKTSLKEFLHHYNTMLQEKYEDEAKADFDTWHKQPGLKSPSPYGKQLSTVYTHAIFKKFQVEVLGVVACHPKIESQDGENTTFKVQDFEENQGYQVIWNEKTSDACCTCRLFEYNGFLCRHVMIVLQISGVNNIPVKYILKCWTKDAKNSNTMRQIDSTESRNKRYSDLCHSACKLGDVGSLSQEAYSIAFAAMEEALRNCENINSSLQNTLGSKSPSNEGLREFEEVSRSKNTSIAIEKGFNSGKQKVHLEQEARITGVHCWDQMGYLNYRAALDCSHASQESVHGMDQLNTIPPRHKDCYSNQIHSQGQEQLNSTASLNGVDRTCLERLQRLGQLQFRPQNVQNPLLNLQNQEFKIMER